MALSDIGIVAREARPVADADLTGNAQPVLREVRDLLARLVEEGEGGAIDLRAMPLSEADRRWLTEQLGEGEVRIELEVSGRSTVSETRAPGVWWVTHRDEKDRVVSEFIEIAWVPELVAAQEEDAKLGLAYLDSLILDLPESPRHE